MILFLTRTLFSVQFHYEQRSKSGQTGQSARESCGDGGGKEGKTAEGHCPSQAEVKVLNCERLAGVFEQQCVWIRASPEGTSLIRNAYGRVRPESEEAKVGPCV